MNKKKLIALAAAVLVVVAAFVGVYLAFSDKPVEGEKSITVEVVDDKGETKEYAHRTTQDYLGAALEEIEGLQVVGEEGQFGLYISHVNGLRAVDELDGAYWSLYVNGEYGNYGIDTQPLQDGEVYAIRYERASR